MAQFVGNLKIYAYFYTMKILHTADIHLGQTLYQSYGREDEHAYFFTQLENLCMEHRPDALIVAGDVFDIQQPSANVWAAFDHAFTSLRRAVPDMAIVIVAGNHDSASRIDSHRRVWSMIDTHLVGHAYGADPSKGQDWEESHIIILPSGFIIAMPYTASPRTEIVQHLLDYVAERNPDSLPVVLTGHTAVAGGDFEGHDIDVGRVRLQALSSFGTGWDYLALGHIHKPQTIVSDGLIFGEHTLPAPVARYSGSALHVSCDERYPHSVSLVEIDRHGGEVHILPLKIEQLRHFHILPENGSAASADEALAVLKTFAEDGGRGYFRFCIAADAQLPSDFNQRVYDIIQPFDAELRYNPKIIWSGVKEAEREMIRPKFEVADIQQMAHPLDFISATIDAYPEFTIEELRQAFAEIEELLSDK